MQSTFPALNWSDKLGMQRTVSYRRYVQLSGEMYVGGDVHLYRSFIPPKRMPLAKLLYLIVAGLLCYTCKRHIRVVIIFKIHNERFPNVFACQVQGLPRAVTNDLISCFAFVLR